MLRTLLRGKIHRATVTGASVDYVGSITLDPDLMRAADIVEFERVQVVDVSNGSRLETYAISGEAGSGTVQLNGAAAHLVEIGDLVIILSYAQIEEEDAARWSPILVFVDERNRITAISGRPSHEPAPVPNLR